LFLKTDVVVVGLQIEIKPHLEIISYVYYRQNITQTSFILEFLITQQKKKILLRNQRPSQELSSKTVNKTEQGKVKKKLRKF
jgi:hypothetical protein